NTLHPVVADARAREAELRARYPDIFTPSIRHRASVVGIIAALAALLVFGLVQLEFSLPKLLLGLGKLAEFLWRMIPPSTGGWSKLLIYLHA
ncbi:hypothetical protein, partial [Raoultella ornithinolytica]|uniref:hypothetical protein n=1 Tax=Raoultella ornithinolytica TaxID=54291 RepID=UPI0019539D7D